MTPKKSSKDTVAVAAVNPRPEEASPAVPLQTRLDNRSIANIFYEVADLMEINSDDSFRIRSYRRAAEALEALSQPVSELISEPKKLLAIPGIGKGMCSHL